MNYEEAAVRLSQLLADADADPTITTRALEEAGAVHTEALLASLEAFNQATRAVKESLDAQDAPKTVTQSGALLQPMPEETAQLRLDFPLTAEQFAILQAGEAPEDHLDRWFLNCEGMHLRYHRNATGFCFFDAEVEHADGGYVVGNVTVNQNDKQYTETNLGVCAAQLKILLANNLGLDDEPYWDEMDAAADD